MEEENKNISNYAVLIAKISRMSPMRKLIHV